MQASWEVGMKHCGLELGVGKGEEHIGLDVGGGEEEIEYRGLDGITDRRTTAEQACKSSLA